MDASDLEAESIMVAIKENWLSDACVVANSYSATKAHLWCQGLSK